MNKSLVKAEIFNKFSIRFFTEHWFNEYLQWNQEKLQIQPEIEMFKWGGDIKLTNFA